jgi:aspartate/methionine/tyrosine aminotransferase
VNTPVQRVLPALFEIGRSLRNQICERIKANFAALQLILEHCPAHALYTEAGWSTVIRLPATRREEDWVFALLREKQVIAQPGYFFDMPGGAYAVVSLITPEEEFREGISRLRCLMETSGP